MKIAMPLAAGRLSMHFGHCEKFAVVDVDDESRQIVGEEELQPPEHEPGVLPRWLKEQGVDVVIAGGMGRRAQQIFSENGIEVVVGAPADSPSALVSAWLDGSLATGDNVCDH